jgi:hypothetical protein
MFLLETTNVFIIPILSIIGLITNILSSIVFSLIIKNGQRSNSDDMYIYLLLKSICEGLGCFFSIFGVLYSYGGTLTNTFTMTVWYIWFKEYIIKALFMASSGFEIAATFNCAISIKKQMKWCEKKLSFWLWVLFIIVLSFGVEMFGAFSYSMHRHTPIDEFNRTINTYFAWHNALYSKRIKYGLGESIIKEVSFLIILLLLNIYILIKLIQIGRRKKKLTSTSINSNRAEKRKIIMIMVLFNISFGSFAKFCLFHV